MPRKRIFADNVGQAVELIIPYLKDTKNTAHKAIYFDGWRGLAASAVLRAIAQDPPPSLLKKFNKIVHIDCSRWKSRRVLQREIAEELKLPQRVMAIFDKQDEEDDFRGVDEGSRAEIQDVGAEIHRAVQEHRCLVVFHNGSNNTVDLNDFGIPSVWFGTKVLWTFRGRLRLNPIISEKVDDSHLYVYDDSGTGSELKYLLQEEAIEIARYTSKLSITPEIAAECCLYLLSLNSRVGSIMDNNWAIHAANYWVCDGIVQGGHDNDAWDVGTALHQQIRLEDYSSNMLPLFGDELSTPPKCQIFVMDSTMAKRKKINTVTIPPESTSFFLAVQSGAYLPLTSLPNDMFHQSSKLRVLKLCCCAFDFSSPPFHSCRNLKFLGLENCMDKWREEEENQERSAMEFFRSLWVLDICYTDWELDLSPEVTEQMAANIREVHIKKGRFWRRNFAWRQLLNLRKLQVIEPTCPWETGKIDEFEDMMKLELLDLSGNCTIQVLPSLAGATGLKTLVLDGCVGLEYVTPEGLPPSLESFSLDAGVGEGHSKVAKISRISLAGCARLVNFRLRGSLPNLKELDLSSTSVKTLDLKDQVVQVPSLQQMILLGCLQLRAILWPEEGLPKMTVLCIDSLEYRVQAEHHQAYATVMDVRFLLSLVLKSNDSFCWNKDKFHLNLCVSCTIKDKGHSCNKEKMCSRSTWQMIAPPLVKSLIPNTYTDVAIDKITADHGTSSAEQFQPLGCHVEIGVGISNTIVGNAQGIGAIIFVMNAAESLHMHDNSSITTVIPEHIMYTRGLENISWHHLKRCRIERCPKLQTVFTANYELYYFQRLETFWAADLMMAHCIWSKARVCLTKDTSSFAKLRSIHLYSCPRLTYVLPLYYFTLRNLETLHIVYCGGLRLVFPVALEVLEEIAADHRHGVLEFPKLKHVYLHELPKLQQICEAKMLAPMLETVKLRGCWSLRRLPAIGSCRHNRRRPIVDCEKNCWEKLEWDGQEAGHHPSLFEPRHSKYYRKALPRVSVLR